MATVLAVALSLHLLAEHTPHTKDAIHWTHLRRGLQGSSNALNAKENTVEGETFLRIAKFRASAYGRACACIHLDINSLDTGNLGLLPTATLTCDWTLCNLRCSPADDPVVGTGTNGLTI